MNDKYHFNLIEKGLGLNSQNTSKQFFTLLEVLVVLAIIGVMSSLLLPALARAHDQAKTLTCINNSKQITLGLIYYTEDQNGCFPYLPENTMSGLGQSGWAVAIDEYAGGKFDYLQNWGTDEWRDFYPECSEVWYCPATRGSVQPRADKIHYGLNISQNGGSRTNNDGTITKEELMGSKMTSFLSPVTRALIADVADSGTQEGIWLNNSLTSAGKGNSWFRNSRTDSHGFTQKVAPRHQSFSEANIGYMDGHADNWKHKVFIHNTAYQEDKQVQAFFGNFILTPTQP